MQSFFHSQKLSGSKREKKNKKQKTKDKKTNPKHFFLHREQSTSSKVTLAFLFALYSNSLISMTLTENIAEKI